MRSWFLTAWGELSCSALPAAKRFFAISKWRMASNVSISLITVSTKNRIFRAKRQLSLIPLNTVATLPAAAEQLNSPLVVSLLKGISTTAALRCAAIVSDSER